MPCFSCRTEFRVWQSGDDLFYIMYDKVSSNATSCPNVLSSTAQCQPVSFKYILDMCSNMRFTNDCCLQAGEEAEETAEGQRKWEKRRVDSFPVASELVNQLMATVVENVKGVRELRHRLFQANFHSTLSGEAMASHHSFPSQGTSCMHAAHEVSLPPSGNTWHVPIVHFPSMLWRCHACRHFNCYFCRAFR